MNRKQLTVMWWAIAITALLLLFPPWTSGHFFRGYAILFYKPTFPRYVDWPRLALQLGIVALATQPPFGRTNVVRNCYSSICNLLPVVEQFLRSGNRWTDYLQG